MAAFDLRYPGAFSVRGRARTPCPPASPIPTTSVIPDMPGSYGPNGFASGPPSRASTRILVVRLLPAVRGKDETESSHDDDDEHHLKPERRLPSASADQVAQAPVGATAPGTGAVLSCHLEAGRCDAVPSR